jgi:mono/diheme cytochrome c family protein
MRVPADATRRVLSGLHGALILGAIALAIAAGCGGGGSPSATADPSSGSSGSPGAITPPPAPDTTPSSGAVAGPNLGPRVFAQRCALCHGPDGRGDGPGSVALNPKPRNFHDQAYMKSRTDAELLEVIRKGKGVMPRWDGILGEAEIQAALAHVRELGRKP